jgi:hypothetical protein
MDTKPCKACGGLGEQLSDKPKPIKCHVCNGAGRVLPLTCKYCGRSAIVMRDNVPVCGREACKPLPPVSPPSVDDDFREAILKRYSGKTDWSGYLM